MQARSCPSQHDVCIRTRPSALRTPSWRGGEQHAREDTCASWLSHLEVHGRRGALGDDLHGLQSGSARQRNTCTRSTQAGCVRVRYHRRWFVTELEPGACAAATPFAPASRDRALARPAFCFLGFFFLSNAIVRENASGFPVRESNPTVDTPREHACATLLLANTRLPRAICAMRRYKQRGGQVSGRAEHGGRDGQRGDGF